MSEFLFADHDDFLGNFLPCRDEEALLQDVFKKEINNILKEQGIGKMLSNRRWNRSTIIFMNSRANLRMQVTYYCSYFLMFL